MSRSIFCQKPYAGSAGTDVPMREYPGFRRRPSMAEIRNIKIKFIMSYAAADDWSCAAGARDGSVPAR
ncbi:MULTISPECIES: hypothetical protein [unclassified Actinoplanes]|uniref:hypothetical protein n=1 Tax=unclassified Actinoplanes TaxID=2626549 RepID=UPI0005BB2676|nr:MULTISPECIES: hypothetical protein [unclassified Actinoplanes]